MFVTRFVLDSMVFSIFITQFYNMSITPKDPLSWTSPVNPVVIPGAGSSYLCSFTVAFLDVQYIDHVIWGLLNLVSLCRMFFEVHLYCNMCQYFYC